MDLRSLVLPSNLVDAPTRLRELVTAIRELIGRLLPLVDVTDDRVPELRAVLGELSAGDIGDFRSEALLAYERERRGRVIDVRTLDFIETEVRNVVIEVGKLLRGARDRLRRFKNRFEMHLQDPEFLLSWALDPQSVLTDLEQRLVDLERMERDLVAFMEQSTRGIEQWIDAVRRIGSPPGPDQQLAVRDARMDQIRHRIGGGIVGVAEQVLRQGGDLFFGDIDIGLNLDLERWVTDHMEVLAENGVRVMMVDLPRTADNQRILDDFFTSGDVGQLTGQLRAISSDALSDAVAADATMFDVARKHGIRVVAASAPYAYSTQGASDWLRLGIPFWAAGYQQVRQELASDERVAIVAPRGLSRSVGGVEGYFSSLFSVDQTYPPFVQDPAIGVGEVAVSPSRSIPMAPDVGVDGYRLVLDDNSDAVFRPPPAR